MPIEALLFDKDGTLFDFAATWGTFAQTFLARIAAGDEARASYLGQVIGFDYEQMHFRPDSVVIAATPDEIAEALLPEMPGMSHFELVSVINEEASKAPQHQAVPLSPFLEELRKKGLKLGVATNDAQEPAMAHLNSVGVHQHFDFIAGFDSGHGCKPGPGQLLAFSGHIGIDPSRIAMVGDSRHDLEAGRAAGMTTVGVLTGIAVAEELADLADFIFPNIGHIPAWLGH